MTVIETELLRELDELDAALGRMRSGGEQPKWQEFFARIDELAEKLPEHTDSRLIHYLRKKSYEKARLWLRGREGENPRGACLGD